MVNDDDNMNRDSDNDRERVLSSPWHALEVELEGAALADLNERCRNLSKLT